MENQAESIGLVPDHSQIWGRGIGLSSTTEESRRGWRAQRAPPRIGTTFVHTVLNTLFWQPASTWTIDMGEGCRLTPLSGSEKATRRRCPHIHRPYYYYYNIYIEYECRSNCGNVEIEKLNFEFNYRTLGRRTQVRGTPVRTARTVSVS